MRSQGRWLFVKAVFQRGFRHSTPLWSFAMSSLHARLLGLPKHIFSLALLAITVVLIGITALVFSQSAQSAKAEVIGVYRDWIVGTYQQDGKKVCNMWSEPKLSLHENRPRGDVNAHVTHFPDASSPQISIRMGYPIGIKQVKVSVGKEKFNFEPVGDVAYAKETDVKRMIKAFRRGSMMLVNSRSTKGTNTKDTFSLSGFTKANDQINKICGE